MTSPAPSIACVRIDWDRTAIPMPQRTFYTLRIDPEPGFPFGRKGYSLAGAWAQLSAEVPGMIGMCVLDGDVAIDPEDIEAMLRAAANSPHSVWTAPVRLWPVSTKREKVAGQRPGSMAWHWGHWRAEPSQVDEDDPVWFSLCLTYLPRPLLEQCVRAGMRNWTYPGVDKRIAAQAQKLRIPVKIVRAARPVHLNY